MKIADIKIGKRHRSDMGDLDALAESIRLEGLLQPIGVTEDGELVFGERRLRACRDILGWNEIEAKVVKVSSIVKGEWIENEIRKDFTPSERVAIGRALEAQIKATLGERRGRPSGEPDTPSLIDADKKAHNCAELNGKETREIAAERAGFGSREEFRRASKVVDKGAPELVQAMDAGEVSISAAAEIADLPQDEQRDRIVRPTPKEAIEESKRTGALVLGRDGKYHAYVEPEVKEQLALWLSFKSALWELSDFAGDPAAVVAAIPPYQRESFAERLNKAIGILASVENEWSKEDERATAAE